MGEIKSIHFFPRDDRKFGCPEIDGTNIFSLKMNTAQAHTEKSVHNFQLTKTPIEGFLKTNSSSQLLETVIMMMRDGFDTFMRILRLLGTLGFCSVFMYWSFTAISKYTEGPISSTVSYQYGDDRHGYIDFPAITICLNSLFSSAEHSTFDSAQPSGGRRPP